MSRFFELHFEGIKFVTVDTQTHLNVSVETEMGWAASSLTSSEARRLRDELNRIYPVETPKPKARPHGAQEYKGNGKHSWENVEDDGSTKRLRVPGGWLYCASVYTDGEFVTANTVFVPVPEAVGYAV